MALNCRIFRDEKGDIDFVQTPDGNRSKLFDTLADMTGGNKEAALNLYALTELEDFKDINKAKLNSFKNNLKALVKPSALEPTKSGFSMVGISTEEAIKRNNGNPLNLAPNGKPSILYKSYEDLGYSGEELDDLVSQVYSNEFLNFFGDWINDPKNASKVVDSNNMPMIVYHGTPSSDIVEFDKNKSVRKSSGLREVANYFTSNIKLAELYKKAEVKEDYKNEINKEINKLKELQYTVRNNRDYDNINNKIELLKDKLSGTVYSTFLNVKEPFIENGMGLDERAWSSFRLPIGYKTASNKPDILDALSGKNYAAKLPIEYDGAIISNIADMASGKNIFSKDEDSLKEVRKDVEPYIGTVVAIWEPNQIKSATENIGTFSTESNNIRFSKDQNQEAQEEIIAGVTDRLKQSGLAKNVYQMTNSEIEAKLVELGVEPTVAKQVVAYHGSPYSFDRFTTEKIGTGEGAQAFGWGLYFTDLDSIAKEYANAAYSTKQEDLGFFELLADNLEDFEYYAKEFSYLGVNKRGEEALDKLKKDTDFYKKEAQKFKKSEKSEDLKYVSYLKEQIKIAEEVINSADEYLEGLPSRNLYKVSLQKGKAPSEYTWLEWDKPVSKDIKNKIQKGLEKIGIDTNFEGVVPTFNKIQASRTGEELYSMVSSSFIGSKSSLISSTDKMASLVLLEAGIDGIKYPAESISRGSTSDTARGFNYVVFDENAVTIEDKVQFSKKGIGVNTAGFTYKGDVYLNSDVMGLDTPIHEFGHLHLDWLKVNRNDLYQSGLSLIESNKEEAQQYIDIVKSTQPNLKEGTEEFKNEVLAQVIGDQGAKLVQSNKEGSISDWLNSVWEAIKNVLGLSNYTAEQVANMTLAEFGVASATDMLSGNRMLKTEALTKNEQVNFSVLSDYRDNNRFAYSDLIYPDVVFKDISKLQESKVATNFYKKIIAKFNKTFDRDLKIETSEKTNDFEVTVEYETGLKPKYFAYPTSTMGEHVTVDNIDKNVPLTSLRHELIHEMLVKNITDKFERINNLDNSANIQSIEEVQRNRAYNYTLEDVFFERVVENVERNPDNKDTFEVSTYGTDVINAIKKEIGEDGFDKDKVVSTLTDLLEGSNSWLSSTLLDIFNNKLDYNVKDLSELSDKVGDLFKKRFTLSKDIFSKELQSKINDFTKFFNEEYTGVLTRLGKSVKEGVSPKVAEGNKLFNAPLEDASIIADEYMLDKGLSTEPIQKILKLDEENSKRIAEEFDKMPATPNDPQTKASYQAMVNETLDQYEKILNKGYKVEINNSEPYNSSADMINDLRDNKRMRIFSTESGFGDVSITDEQRANSPMLQKTKFKDVNGAPLLVNDIFRFVHDFFGHAKFGNGFGAIGEENAWNVHSRMYSPLARRAMTTETRGQNSWVNFSGVNDEAFKKRDKARVLRQEGKIEEAAKLSAEVYEEMKFADQKIGLLPEWVSMIDTETPTVEKPNVRTPVVDMNGARVFAANRVNPITGEDTGQIELQLLESDEKGKGNARRAAEAFLKYADSIGKDVYIAVSSRDGGITEEDRLGDFYRSLGFRNTSKFEMIRKAKPSSPKGFDKNGEPDASTVLQFNSAKTEALENKEIIDVQNAMLGFGLTSSKDLYTSLMKALSTNGVVTFSRMKLERSKMYNDYEIDMILNSPGIQRNIRETLLKLRNTEEFSVEYNPVFVIPMSSELTSLGKQRSSNPFEIEREIAEAVSEVAPEEIPANLDGVLAEKYTQDKEFKALVDDLNKTTKSVPVKTVINGELVDKLPSTIGSIANTITDDYNGSMSENIDFLNNSIKKETWEDSRNAIGKILNKIKKDAAKNGIDLRDLATKAITHSREDVLDFLNAMEDVLVDPLEQTLSSFADMYNAMFDITEPSKELIITDNKSDVFLDTENTEYELFRDHNLVKKQDGVYRIVTEQSLEDMYDSMIENVDLLPGNITSVEDLKNYVSKTTSKLEVPDFQVDTELLEKMLLYKMYFGFPLVISTKKVSTQGLTDLTMDPGLLKDDFVIDFNKWILETNNKYFTVTEKGIELIANDEINKSEAILSLPEEFKESLAQYDVLSRTLNLGLEPQEKAEEYIDSQKEKRQDVVNNPESVKKLKGNYTYLEDGVMAAKNETETFVRTPVGVFEMIYQFGNVKFYNKLPDADIDYKLTDIEKPLSDIDFSQHQHLENSPEIFKEAKQYYTKKELEQINNEYFNCK